MYQSPRGTQDILPEDAVVWRHVERHAEATARRFGYGEIRTPTFEETGLFVRGVGEGTDIVDKEIYRFEDKGRRRPRAAARGAPPRPCGRTSSTAWPVDRSRSSCTRC